MANAPQPRSPEFLRSPVKAPSVQLITHPPRLRHLREPVPLHFPVEAKVSEGGIHQDIRTFLASLLRFRFGEQHTIGSDHFVYWNARNPKRCASPDVFVRLGT